MDYKKVLRLHYVNKLSYREIADSCSDCSKSALGEFLKRFKECQELSYVKKLPRVKELNQEYARILSEKKAAYAEYHSCRQDMQEYLIAQKNLEMLYGEEANKAERKNGKESRERL